MRVSYQVVDGVLQHVVAGHEVAAVAGLGLDKQVFKLWIHKADCALWGVPVFVMFGKVYFTCISPTCWADTAAIVRPSW